ncbi:hypothetical protein BaRGS_00000680, partial [Batillaria attramentaria]
MSGGARELRTAGTVPRPWARAREWEGGGGGPRGWRDREEGGWPSAGTSRGELNNRL